MRPTQMDNILIRILYVIATAIVGCQAFGVNRLTSVLFGATFVLMVLVWLSAAYRRVTWLDAVTILTVALAFAHVVLNAWSADTQLSLSYFKKYIMFAFTLLFFQIANKLTADEGLARFLMRLNTGIALFLMVFYLGNREMAYLYNGRITQYLTFRFTNPNLAAMFLLCIYMGELEYLFQPVSQMNKVFHIVTSCVMLYFLAETRARNCQIVAVMMTLMAVYLYFQKRNVRIPRSLLILIVLWPLLFAFIYLAVIETPLIQTLFAFIADEGKELNSRVLLWNAALQWFWKSPILGAYSQISRGTGMSQMHNTHIDIMVSYGLTVLLLVCYLLYSLVRNRDGQAARSEMAARLFFAGTVMMGMGEAALYSGGLGLYLWAGRFLLMNQKLGAEEVDS